ncbi:porin family protein [Hymenobacter sp. BT491]|uniref:porin family protein n=1 Tax=Hymenobacter sp. BT491 TaxID=2766779 RepID=UPI0016534A4B|nr:porin family protein [Hymenobacter sp. BT491]MBC6991119.1 PorT family protein [Hymenobacter sp. BT491]
MKKIILLLTFCAASFTAVQAQDGHIGERKSTDYPSGGSDSRNSGFGIKGGFNAADFRGDDKKNFGDNSNYKSFHAGVYAQIGLNDKFSIQPEFLYSRQGFKASNPGNTTMTSPYTTRLDYLQVPVLLVYNFLDNVSVHVGPQVSLLTKVKEGSVERKINDSQYNYNYSSLDYGLAAGLEARVGPGRVGARYTAGFADILKDPKSTVNQSITNIKNGVFQVYVGIGFAQ